MDFSERLKAMRKKKGLTQKELADALGIPYQGISQYERGIRNPKYQTVEKIARTLNCQLSELLDSKEHAHMIIDNVIESGDLEDDSILDAFDEIEHPGIIVQRYTRFITEHPHLMQTLKEIGIELEIIDWYRIRIKHNYQESEEITSDLMSDLELLHEDFICNIRDLFKNNYGFDMSEED